RNVTGVQTCALPICRQHPRPPRPHHPAPPRPRGRPARGVADRAGLAQGARPGPRRGAMTGLLRSWDVGTARIPPRRAGAVIDLAQLPLRPLLTLPARPRWLGTAPVRARGPVIARGTHPSAFDPRGYGHLLRASGIAPRFLAKESLFRLPVLGALLRGARQIPVRRGTTRSGDALTDARAA